MADDGASRELAERLWTLRRRRPRRQLRGDGRGRPGAAGCVERAAARADADADADAEAEMERQVSFFLFLCLSKE